MILTFFIDELLHGIPGLVVTKKGDVGRQAVIDTMCCAADAFLPQVSHEELQANKSEDAQTEDGEDHHISEFLHRLDQSSDDGLQACRTELLKKKIHKKDRRWQDEQKKVAVGLNDHHESNIKMATASIG